MKLVVVFAIAFMVIGSIACEAGEDGGSPPLNIPDDVSYSVINTDTIPGIKKSLDVRLNKKVSQDVLRAIAVELKSDDSRQYDRTFIAYYLPDMTIGAGAWATTHFDPTLDVRILGLTAQQEEALLTEPTLSGREVIGRWLDETPFIGSIMTIYREGGILYMDWKFTDGSVLKEAMVEKPSPLGQRFEKSEESSFGEYWIIDQDGILSIYDNAGLIHTASRVP